MNLTPERRSSAFYQRRHRDRLREQGLMKKELWVLPEYADDLTAIERRMRKPRNEALRGDTDLGDATMNAAAPPGFADTASSAVAVADAAYSAGHRAGRAETPLPWSALSLYDAIASSALAQDAAITAEWIEGAEPGLHVTMHDYGDLPLFMAVVGQQIVVEAMLWPAAQVRDVARFNDEILRTHKLFPLSTLGIERMDGEEVYIMFGALSSASSLADVLFEIETLADNVIRATEAFELHLREIV